MSLLKEFNITGDHLKLLKRLNFDYDGHCEFGAPEVCPKRPYGNSDVYSDIIAILGLDPKYNRNGEMENDMYEFLNTTHEQMETVLQIICRTMQISEGLYKKDCEYGKDWYKVEVTNEVV